MARIGSQLSGLSQSIASLMADVDPEFLKIGRKLQSIYSESEELSQMAMDAVDFVDNRTGEMPLANVGAFARESVEKLKSFQREISESLESLCSGRGHLEKLSGSAEKIVDEATSEISQLIGTSLSSLKNAGECSSAIASQVSQIVMAIQFHDIVRQQIEHVVMGLNDAGNICTRPQQDSGHGVSLNDTVSRAYPIVKLQNAQIKNAVSEIDDAHRKILNAFESIETKGSELVTCMGSSITSLADGNKDKSPFSAITVSLENLNDLMSQADNLNCQVEKAFAEAAESTSELSKHIGDVQKISLELHRKALNAIIKSAHLGYLGRTLEVFAKEVARTSDNTNDFTEGVTGIIEKIKELRGGLEHEPSNIHEPGSLVDTPPEITIDQSKETISNAYHMFLKNSSMTSTLSQKLESSIADAKSELSFMPDFSNKMIRLLEQSEALLEQIGRWRREAHQNTATGMIETSQRYTMESERAVHASLPEGLAAEGSPEIALENTAGDVDSNIELFDEEDSLADAPVDTETDEASDDNIELF